MECVFVCRVKPHATSLNFTLNENWERKTADVPISGLVLFTPMEIISIVVLFYIAA